MYKNKWDKAFFQHDMTYQGFKKLSRTFAGKILRDKTFNISKNLKYDGYQKDLVSTVYKFVDKKIFLVVLKILVVLKMKIFLIKN